MDQNLRAMNLGLSNNSTHLLILPFPLTMNRFDALLFVFTHFLPLCSPLAKKRGDCFAKILLVPTERDRSDETVLRNTALNMAEVRDRRGDARERR